MSSINSINSIDMDSSNVAPVPAYEANPTLLAETQPTAPAFPDVTLYGAITVEQKTVTTPDKSPAQTLTAVSPLVLPAQQPQTMANEKPGTYTLQQGQLQQQPLQLQQLIPQQQQPQQMQQLIPQQQQQQPQMQQLSPQLQQQQQQPQLYMPQTQSPLQQQLYSQQQQQQLQQQQTPPFQQKYQTAVRLANLQEAAAPVDCPVCGQREITIVQRVSGNTTHLWAVLTCLFIGLGCIPYLMHGLKDAEHKCGHCGVLLARWHKSGRTVVLQHA